MMCFWKTFTIFHLSFSHKNQLHKNILKKNDLHKVAHTVLCVLITVKRPCFTNCKQHCIWSNELTALANMITCKSDDAADIASCQMYLQSCLYQDWKWIWNINGTPCQWVTKQPTVHRYSTLRLSFRHRSLTLSMLQIGYSAQVFFFSLKWRTKYLAKEDSCSIQSIPHVYILL